MINRNISTNKQVVDFTQSRQRTSSNTDMNLELHSLPEGTRSDGHQHGGHRSEVRDKLTEDQNRTDK